jgi:hypothetical protein
MIEAPRDERYTQLMADAKVQALMVEYCWLSLHSPYPVCFGEYVAREAALEAMAENARELGLDYD